jgi:Leucine-rich repeat (LRR) protein
MNTDVKSLSPLGELTKLRYMNASACAVSDLTPLRGLTQLEILEIADNNQDMGSLSGVSGLTRLKKLFVGGNKLGQLDALNTLHKLEILELYNAEIETFNLDTLLALKELKLGECNLDVLPLPYLPELRRLDVSDNQLTEFSPNLLRLLPKLDELNLWGNPIENLPKEICNYTNSLHQVKAFFAQNK